MRSDYTLFVLYVADQDASRRFYEQVLEDPPSLHEPGMTEFELDGRTALGLMPASGIRRLLGESLPDVGDGAGSPRCEIYLVVPDAARYHARALQAGARELSPLQPRDWGQAVAYSLDPDGHVLAFAEAARPEEPTDR